MHRPISRLLIAGILILLLAIGLQFRNSVVLEAHPRLISLKALLPAGALGWTSVDQPIAETELMKRAVSELLNYDEAILRSYSRGADQISVYVAYWRPGTMHPRLITQHLPDTCWPGLGWTNLQPMGTAVFALPGGKQTWSGQSRIFAGHGITQYVVYWHLVGGRLSGYAQGPDSKRATYHLTLWDDIRYGQREQYFVRISSNLPIDELGRSDPMQTILQALMSLGLTEETH